MTSEAMSSEARRHEDPFVAFLGRMSLVDDLAALSEAEFRQRTKLVAEYSAGYANVAQRFVSLLEADALHLVQLQERLNRVDSPRRELYSSLGSPAPHERIRTARSASPAASRPDQPAVRGGYLYLPAGKLDHTDATVAPNPGVAACRRSASQGQGARLRSTSAPTSCSSEVASQAVAQVTLSTEFAERRKASALRRLDKQLTDHARVVHEFETSEQRRIRAFQRREALLLKKAVDNEQRNTAAAIESARLRVKRFEEAKPLRLRTEDKREATRIAKKTRILEQQAAARASRALLEESAEYVQRVGRAFDDEMAKLQSAALAAARTSAEACSRSRVLLNHVLAERNIKQGRLRRVFDGTMEAELQRQKRRDDRDICSVVAAKYAEPAGAEVRWSAESPTPAPTSLLRDPLLQGTHGRDAGAGNSTRSRDISTPLYARLCGPRDGAVLGLGEATPLYLGGDGANSGANDPSGSFRALVQGVRHVGWR